MKSNKELKDHYKEKKFKIGVFQIRNISNNKLYIEGSLDLEAIWNRHKFQLNAGLHQNINLQNEWKFFGQDNFIYEILSELKQDESKIIDYRKEVKELERMFIEELQPFEVNGYHVKM